ncbi:hypothetical protein CRYUN_Cryun26dG0128700 [Craigia yunnanensis]
MPVYQPSSRREADMKLDSQVLDLETTMKDGILGGDCGVKSTSFASKKLDLEVMIEEFESMDVPMVFICPISLESMQDPVTLCIGKTYERLNILKWFSLSHYTCPNMMQELWDNSETPNKKLQQLIYSWFSQNYLAMKKGFEDVQWRIKEILENLKKVKGVGLISSLLGPFTTHAVGSKAICKFAPEEYASLAVDVGLATKLLLVIQSGYNPILKQRSAELLKLCRLNYTATIIISKCKLTRIIQ